MCTRFEEWKQEIEHYCNEHSLSFEKAKKMVMCENEDTLVLQYYEKHSDKTEIHNEIPLPVVLWAFRKDSGVEFKQTENTLLYLST